MVLLDNGGGAALGRLSLLLPPANLHGLVEHLAVLNHPPRVREWRIVPDLSPHLIVWVADEEGGRRARGAIVGARSRSVVVDVSRRTLMVAVRLRPGAIPSLLRCSAADLTDRAVPLADAFDSRVLRETEIGVDTPPALLVNELLRIVRRAAHDPAPGPIGKAMEHAGRVRSLAEALGVAEPTIRDRTIREVGLPPKRALSIVRLYRALFAAHACRSWVDVAQEAGYADQAHLIREWHVLLGVSPSAWMARPAADSFKTDAAQGM